MSNLASSPNYERAWANRRDLQHDILLHLTERGSAKWGALYSHFDQHGTGEIGEALQHLAHWRYIMIESDGTAKITASGMRQLKSLR